jgi:glycosyltransferase involved in cell wall biosynthesis
MLAALEDRKRHVAFIEAFQRIRSRIPNVRLLLAGEGPVRDAITATLARLGLASNVKLLGFYPQPERLIALADLTVLTSVREGLPRVVVQSLAGGKPVVITRLLGIEDLIAHDVNGLVMPEEDLDATANAIADVLTNPERLQRMQHYARQTDVSSWDIESMCQTLDEIYGRFVPGNDGRARLGAAAHDDSRLRDRASA